jgi:aspartate racemase
MKTIGLIGGMSWESTLVYYRLINEAVRAQRGGHHSARLLLCSLDFAPIERMQAEGRWDDATAVLVDAARRLERGGADFGLLCTNTMHRVFDAIAAQVGLPLVHIADATAQAVAARGLARVGLLGTRFTMEQAFYRERLATRGGLDVLVPDEPARALVHRVIYEELCQGRVEDASRRDFCRIARELATAGAEGVVLGCTEIGLLIGPGDLGLPVFDTTRLHAEAAVALALQAG